MAALKLFVAGGTDMKFTHGLAVAAAISVAGAMPALAWYPYGSGSSSYDRSYTGAYGQTYSESGGCSYGGGSASCDRSATGAYGRTYSSSGSATYGAEGGSYSRTVSAPYGGSYYGSGSYYRPRW